MQLFSNGCAVAHHFEVDGFIRLQANDQLVSEGVETLIQLSSWRPELDADLHLALIQSLASLQDEGHTIPSALQSRLLRTALEWLTIIGR